MRSNKLTPLEVLRKHKTDLQKQSDTLTGAIEKKFSYLQSHIVPLLGNSLLESSIAKMSPFVRNWVKGDSLPEQENGNKPFVSRSLIVGIAAGLLKVIPFFIKNQKGLFFIFVLKQLLTWVSDKKTR